MAISSLPWTVHCCQFAKEAPGSACGLNGESFDRSYDECHHPLSLDEAEFICRCVNSWDALVLACEQSVRELERLYTGQPPEALKDNATYQKLLAALKAAGRAYAVARCES